jgi:hypothetical protein
MNKTAICCALQTFQSFTQLIRCHAKITSGAYKFRGLQKGVTPPPGSKKCIEFRDMTDDEKLKHVMEEMCRHVDWIREGTENIMGNLEG